MRQEFPSKVKLAAFERANGHCESCGMKIIGRAEFDHALPDFFGGKPTLENCQAICSKCHRSKTSTADIPRIAKTKRQHAKNVGAWPKPYRKLQSRNTFKPYLPADKVPDHDT